MNYLALTLLFPFLGFLILACFNRRLGENGAAVIGVGSMALSALSAVVVGCDFFAHGAATYYDLPLLTWIDLPGLQLNWTLHLDGLSLTMLGVVSGVGFLIHLFASWYMRQEEGYARFFAYMNLFVAAMLMLVLGSSLPTIYVGWEGVGLCSYLLIGFYYKVSANGAAAQKAFIVTRIGDVFFALGMFLLYHELGTLDVQQLLVLAPQHFAQGSLLMTAATALLLGGAVGKSAQLPLQTWLADAMAGPTPVSALIHAATMVTAGVYLIARTHTLFELAPATLDLVGWVGAITLLLAGFAAIVQTDIKRVLAYSTMSQIGYMFLALGVGAWQAAVFHLMAHAFFKALLFLSSGAVILACHHEQNIFKMGGLWKKIPFVYACFLVGGGALAALPWVTVGFYSKDEILWQAMAGQHWAFFDIGLAGAFLTSLYTFRMIFIVFHGREQGHAHAISGASYWLPLGVLLVLSTAIGALIHPPLAQVLPAAPATAAESLHDHVELIAAATGLSGLLLAALLYLGERRLPALIARLPLAAPITRLWYQAWGFDAVYDLVFVRGYRGLTLLLRRDPADQTINLVPRAISALHSLGSRSQNGQLRLNVAVFAGGAILLLFIASIILN